MPGLWNTHPRLRGRIDEQHPDDLRVIAHHGGPRLSRVSPEVVWVRVTGCDGDVWSGTVLGRTHRRSPTDAIASIRFKVPETSALAVMVSDKYLEERPNWIVHPCDRCGIAELFDAPSDLIRVVFESEPDRVEVDRFTAICGWCGGSQFVERAGRPYRHTCQWLGELWDRLVALSSPGLKTRPGLHCSLRNSVPGVPRLWESRLLAAARRTDANPADTDRGLADGCHRARRVLSRHSTREHDHADFALHRSSVARRDRS